MNEENDCLATNGPGVTVRCNISKHITITLFFLSILPFNTNV